MNRQFDVRRFQYEGWILVCDVTGKGVVETEHHDGQDAVASWLRAKKNRLTYSATLWGVRPDKTLQKVKDYDRGLK